MRDYPRYSIWKDRTTDSWEVVRWDTATRMEIVQANIRTNEKAQVALADWRKRSGGDHAA